MAGENCSYTLPFSDVYLKGVTLTEKVCIIVVTVLTVAVLLLFADKVWFILRHYRSHSQVNLVKHKSLWLVGLYPVVALDSLLAIYVPRARLLCDFVSVVYLALCLYHFTSLIILYFGGESQMLDRIRDTGFNFRTPPCCCCCFCCPTVEPTPRTLQRVRLMVLQTAFLQPILSFVSVVLWLDGMYSPNVTSPDSVSTYFLVVSSVSTLLAMYGLVVLFRSTRRHLETHNVTPKFFVLQLMLVVLNLQGFVIKFLADKHIPPCSNGVVSSVVRGEAIQHMLLIAETFLLALGARVVYRKPLKREMDEEELDSADEKLERTLKDIPTNDKARLIKNIDPIDVRSYHSVNESTDARESAARIVDLMDNAGRTAYGTP